MEQGNVEVSIIIVNYNTCDLLKNCIRSVYEYTSGVKYEILVSDNGSKDGSLQMLKREFRDVIVIENNENLGFGAANNRALEKAKGEFIFYLNSDTLLCNNAVYLFWEYWRQHESEKLGCLGTWLKNVDGKDVVSYAAYPTPLGTLIALLHMYWWSVTKKKLSTVNMRTYEKRKSALEIAGYISGADMFVKKDEDAFFDESFFMYSEEADLQFNGYYRKNKKCILIPEPEIVHLVGGSGKDKKDIYYDFNKKTVKWLWISALRFQEKNGKKSVFIIKLIRIILKKIYTELEY